MGSVNALVAEYNANSSSSAPKTKSKIGDVASNRSVQLVIKSATNLKSLKFNKTPPNPIAEK